MVLVTSTGRAVANGGHITNADVHPENTILCNNQAPLFSTRDVSMAPDGNVNGAEGENWASDQGGSMVLAGQDRGYNAGEANRKPD